MKKLVLFIIVVGAAQHVVAVPGQAAVTMRQGVVPAQVKRTTGAGVEKTIPAGKVSVTTKPASIRVSSIFDPIDPSKIWGGVVIQQ